MSRGAPRTKAGVRLFTDMEPMDMLESDGVTPEDILAVEGETLAEVLDEVERVVRKRMRGGVWMSEERVLAIIAELRKEKP